MSQVVYNGVTLETVGTERYHKEAIYDGPNYLYTRHTLVVSAVYNPERTAYRLQPPPNAGPQRQRGRPAPETDEAIRHRLSQPRGVLEYTVGDQIVIRAPEEKHTTDATNGPEPIHVSVTRIIGSKTWFVQFAIKTDINECQKYLRTDPSPILSHTWVASEELDQDFFSTRIIQGRVVFHGGRLRFGGAVADDYRNAVWHPVLSGFKRDKAQVRISEDGLVMDYVVVDRETGVSIIAGQNVTRIEAIHQHQVNTPGTEQFIVNMLEAGAGYIEDMLENVLGVINDVANLRVPTPRRIPVRSFFRILTTFRNNLPTRTQRCVARVWGNRNSRRRDLQRVAVRIVTARLLNILGPAVPVVGSVTHDLMGKFVEAELSVLGAPLSRPVVGGHAGFWAENDAIFPQDDGIPEITSSGRITGPLPPNSSRGTAAEALVAQALMTDCAPPARPTRPRGAQSRPHP